MTVRKDLSDLQDQLADEMAAVTEAEALLGRAAVMALGLRELSSKGMHPDIVRENIGRIRSMQARARERLQGIFYAAG